ncbi:ribbon-helix-helix domain-containing protein [Asticcacaulis benevestitus]|uniref:Addiction module antitoxin n=1 Tax=Asticcacaulis benevestitus DSM 16100 = ATCC BAA-896 TaxID=1121022 RepID=V4PVM9_9CAUL|nr:hypothetical protein [Asticcacaulis benevestitus]ESQ92446.1 hypothetical protein ABENE_08700 [Asticcacaulis benevestitus DSM 16100 = ATCC BAA-896]
MGKMSISLDEQSRAWITGQTEDAETYVNALVHQDQLRKAAEAELRDLLENARNSGVTNRTPQQIMMDVQAELKLSGRV